MIVKIPLRRFVRIVTFTLALIVVIAGVSFSGYNLATRYRSTIELSYQQALNEFSDYVTSVQSALTKGEYASTHTSQYTMAVNLSEDSLGAKSALSRLPLTYGECEKLQKYLSQVGDFSNYIIAKLSRGEELSQEDKDSIIKLKEYAQELAPQIEDIATLYANGEVFLGQEKTIESNLENLNEDISTFTLDKDFEQIDKDFEDYPSLVYDGPFSDQVQQKEPRMFEDTQVVSIDEALKIASDFLNTEEKNLKYENTRKGNVQCYVFSKDEIYISVTVHGGYIEEMYKNVIVDEKKIEYLEAIKNAQEFLNEIGMKNMKESYYVTSGNICTINFASVQDDVVCYSDLIKVGVDLKTGEIVNYNAQGYIMNHYDREIQNPDIELIDAQLSLNEDLKIETSQLTMIPTGGTQEVLCYEFKCVSSSEERILVYVNANTGDEENILMLLQADGGTLVL